MQNHEGSLYIAEVGPGSYFSVTGSGRADFEAAKTTPRIVIFPPFSVNRGYGAEIYRDERDQFVAYTPRTGIPVISHDIYSGECPDIRPKSVGLIVLENVVNDVIYLSHPDYPRLVSFLEGCIAEDGLVLFIDDINPQHKIQRYIQLRHCMSDSFREILNDISQFENPNPFEYPAISSSKEKLEAVLTRLSRLGITDQALEQSLQRSAQGVYNACTSCWLLFQRKP